MPVFDKLMLRKRAIIETIYDQLKNISQVEHTRHRPAGGGTNPAQSGFNFLVNVVSALIAYTYQEKKPSLNLRVEQPAGLPAIIL